MNKRYWRLYDRKICHYHMNTHTAFHIEWLPWGASVHVSGRNQSFSATVDIRVFQAMFSIVVVVVVVVGISLIMR